MDEAPTLDPQRPSSRRYAGLLGLIGLIGLGLDRLWLHLDRAVPDAAQAQVLNQLYDHSGMAIAHPFFYTIAAFVQTGFGEQPDQLLWTQAGFSGLLLIAVYGIGQQLFTRSVGLWAAGFCSLLPALLALRLRFSLDLPLVAMVMLSLWRLLIWQSARKPRWPAPPPSPRPLEPIAPDALPWERELQLLRQTIATRTPASIAPKRFAVPDWITPWTKRLTLPPLLQPWANAIGLGIVLGLTWLTHPLSLIYLLLPFGAAGLAQLLNGRWWGGCQCVLAGLISWMIAWPIDRHNLPDRVLAALRSPQILDLDRWHWDGGWLIGAIGWLAAQLFYPLGLVGLVGLLLYRQRVAAQILGGRQSLTAGATRLWRRQVARSWWQAIGILVSWIGLPLALIAGFITPDYFMLLPMIPLAIILLTQGLLLFPPSFFQIRWLVLGLMLVWSLANLFPIVPLRVPQLLPQPNHNWHQAELLQTVRQGSPGLYQTIGVLPQTAQLNADYLTYLSRSLQLPIVATTVDLASDQRQLPWYVLKTGDQGGTASLPTLTRFTQALRRDPALQLAQTWPLPDGNELQLWQRRQALVQLTPIVGAQWSDDRPIKLEKVQLPPQAVPGQPIPITYTWAGQPQELQAGSVEITWRRDRQPPPKVPQQWFQDHPIGLGQLHPIDRTTELAQVTEQTSTIAPAGATGRYVLEAIYLNPAKGERYPLVTPDTSIELVAKLPATQTTAPAVDLLTQLHRLAQSLMQSPDFAALQTQLNQLDRADPTHQSLKQWRQLIADRLEAEPFQTSLYPDLALAQFLQGDMPAAIATLTRLIEQNPRHPHLPLYLAIASAAAGDPAAAQAALAQRQLPVPAPLEPLILALKGNPIAQWQLYRLRLDLMLPTYRRMN
jgi:4-amino-4-deoxy-L-arabinose transferase-like glycosyltransferase